MVIFALFFFYSLTYDIVNYLENVVSVGNDFTVHYRSYGSLHCKWVTINMDFNVKIPQIDKQTI